MLSFMFVSNCLKIVSKRLEDYTVRLAPAERFLSRGAGDQQPKMPCARKQQRSKRPTEAPVRTHCGRERLRYFEARQEADRPDHPRIRRDRISQRQQARRRPHGRLPRRKFRSPRRTRARAPRRRFRRQRANRFPRTRKASSPFCCSATSTPSIRWARSPPCPATSPTIACTAPACST